MAELLTELVEVAEPGPLLALELVVITVVGLALVGLDRVGLGALIAGLSTTFARGRNVAKLEGETCDVG